MIIISDLEYDTYRECNKQNSLLSSSILKRLVNIPPQLTNCEGFLLGISIMVISLYPYCECDTLVTYLLEIITDYLKLLSVNLIEAQMLMGKSYSAYQMCLLLGAFFLIISMAVCRTSTIRIYFNPINSTSKYYTRKA